MNKDGISSDWRGTMPLLQGVTRCHEGNAHRPEGIEFAVRRLEQLTARKGTESGVEFTLAYLASMLLDHGSYADFIRNRFPLGLTSGFSRDEAIAIRAVCQVDADVMVVDRDALRAGLCRLTHVINAYVATETKG